MYIFKFADIGEGIHEGKVSDILVKEGDSVNDGTDLFSVETDKITTEISSPVKGVISKILIKVGETIHVGDAIFEIDDSNSSSPAVAATPAAPAVSEEPKGESKGASVVGEVKVSDAVLPLFGSNSLNVTKSSSANNEVVNKDVLASPVARAFAKSHNVNLGLVKGTGELG
ncbi:MAG: biotin/lipoyl-binding protein, partial [Malacoplasma sp.]|nr:biotin/lipoyl-binding protein [Malacoplasma sp.]